MADLSKSQCPMKRIVILLLALLPVTASAQKFNTEGGVSWSCVYETDMTQDDIYKQVLAYGFIEDAIIYENMIVGNITPVSLDYAGAGYSRMKVPLYLSNGQFSGRYVMQFKEGKYRVDVYNMYFFDSTGRTSFNSCAGEFGFDIATKIIGDYLNNNSQFQKWSDEW